MELLYSAVLLSGCRSWWVVRTWRVLGSVGKMGGTWASRLGGCVLPGPQSLFSLADIKVEPGCYFCFSFPFRKCKLFSQNKTFKYESKQYLMEIFDFSMFYPVCSSWMARTSRALRILSYLNLPLMCIVLTLKMRRQRLVEVK